MDPVSFAHFRRSCFEKIFAILDDYDRKYHVQSAHKNTQCIRFENDDSNLLIDDGTDRFQSNENVDPTKILLTNKAEPTPLDLDLCNHREILHGELVDDSVPDVEEQKEMDLQIVQSDHTPTHDHDFSNHYQAIKNEPISIPIHEINDEQVEKHVTLPTAIVQVPPSSEIVRSCSTPRQLVPAALFGSRISFNFVSIESPRVYLPPKPPDIIAAPILSRKLSPSNSLTNFYSKGGYYTYARQMLDEMPEQDVVSFPQQHSVLCSIMFPPVSSRALLSVMNQVLLFFTHLPAFIFGVVSTTYFSWRLALAAFPTLLLVIIPDTIYDKYLISLSKSLVKEYGKANVIAQHTLISIKNVYSFTIEKRIMERIVRALARMIQESINCSSNVLDSLCPCFPLRYGVHVKASEPPFDCEELEEVIWGVAGLVIGLYTFISATYRTEELEDVHRKRVKHGHIFVAEIRLKWRELLSKHSKLYQGSITRGLQIMKECPQALFSKYLGLENYDSKGTINCYGGLHGIGSSTDNELETSSTITGLNEKCRGTVRNNAMDLKCLIVVWNCIEVTNETLEAGVDIDGKAIVLIAGVGWIGKPADEMLSLIGRLSSSQWYKTVFEDQIDAEANLGTFYLKDAKQTVEEIPNITPAQFMMEIVLHRKMIYNGIVQTAKGLLKWKALPPKHGTWKYSSLRTRMFEGARIVTVNKY